MFQIYKPCCWLLLYKTCCSSLCFRFVSHVVDHFYTSSSPCFRFVRQESPTSSWCIRTAKPPLTTSPHTTLPSPVSWWWVCQRTCQASPARVGAKTIWSTEKILPAFFLMNSIAIQDQHHLFSGICWVIQQCSWTRIQKKSWCGHCVAMAIRDFT